MRGLVHLFNILTFWGAAWGIGSVLPESCPRLGATKNKNDGLGQNALTGHQPFPKWAQTKTPNPAFSRRRGKFGAYVQHSSLLGVTQGASFYVRNYSLGINQVRKENNHSNTTTMSFIPKRTAHPGHPKRENKVLKPNSGAWHFQSTFYSGKQTVSYKRDRDQNSHVKNKSTLEETDTGGIKKLKRYS